MQFQWNSIKNGTENIENGTETIKNGAEMIEHGAETIENDNETIGVILISSKDPNVRVFDRSNVGAFEAASFYNSYS